VLCHFVVGEGNETGAIPVMYVDGLSFWERLGLSINDCRLE
jgi:hypothetical protein